MVSWTFSPLPDICKACFPHLHTHYEECLQYIVQHMSHNNLPIYTFWEPLLSWLWMQGRVWTLLHTNADKYIAGPCVMVGFGPYDYHCSAKLVINLGDEATFCCPSLPPVLYICSLQNQDSGWRWVVWVTGVLSLPYPYHPYPSAHLPMSGIPFLCVIVLPQMLDYLVPRKGSWMLFTMGLICQ